MAVTVSGTSITFNDATVQTTAGGAVNTTTVLAATAGASAGAVGTYAFAKLNSNLAFGSTVAGSSLAPTAAAYHVYKGSGSGSSATFAVGSALSGTWRAMGTQTYTAAGPYSDPTIYGATLWLRIS